MPISIRLFGLLFAFTALACSDTESAVGDDGAPVEDDAADAGGDTTDNEKLAYCQSALDPSLAVTPAGAQCLSCMAERCCDEVYACHLADGCDPNFKSAEEAGEDAIPIIQCQATLCENQCELEPLPEPRNPWRDGECNPVTNEGCEGSEACTSYHPYSTGAVAWRCEEPIFGGIDGPVVVERQGLCSPCEFDGECEGTLKCYGQCARYCCDDSDCGSGRCVKLPTFPPFADVGICQTESGEIACDAPAEAPSEGACWPPEFE